jgi:hypothetical protein
MKAFFATALLPICVNALGQTSSISWQKRFGGTNQEKGYEIHQTFDGGYIVSALSTIVSGDVTSNKGASDFWIVKLTNTGAVSWQKSYGGTGMDQAFSIIQTADSGYVVAGLSNSFSGDVTATQHGLSDAWILKLSKTGAIQWQQMYGGFYVDYFNCIRQTTDGGFIAAGYTESSALEMGNGYHGGGDMWVMKMNSTGGMVWQKAFGGTGWDVGYAIQQTSDGNYIVCGTCDSANGDINVNHGKADGWIIKVGGTGNIIWQKAIGGSENEIAYDVVQTTDGGYITIASTVSNDGDVSGSHGQGDVWIVKLNSSGGITWQKALGGSGIDRGTSIIQTSDGNYFFTGDSQSSNGDLTNNYGWTDMWTGKLSTSGNIIWQKSIGGSDDDAPSHGIQTSDGNYIISGTIVSLSGNVPPPINPMGSEDLWIIKLADPAGITAASEEDMVSIKPNPVADVLHLELKSNITPAEITVSDLYGRIIKTVSVTDNQTSLSVAGLPSGVYTVTIITATSFSTQRFIKR